jgi:hypothetical protein
MKGNEKRSVSEALSILQTTYDEKILEIPSHLLREYGQHEKHKRKSQTVYE